MYEIPEKNPLTLLTTENFFISTIVKLNKIESWSAQKVIVISDSITYQQVMKKRKPKNRENKNWGETVTIIHIFRNLQQQHVWYSPT
jgi:hypothetical protein